MKPSPQPGREKDIFEQALELSSAEARLGYVKGACGADAALLDRVETLLRAHEAPGGFLPERPGMAANPTVHHSLPEGAEKPGTVIGRYKLLEKIGEGGFGSVYMAEQEVPVRRRVALKVIKLGMDTKEVVARFEAERQALAMMDHPNIAKVLDAGSTDTGRPYFVMELVKGMPITAYCDQIKLSTVARLELFILACQAVQHAHQKGIIHRDLKPSNILVTEQDGRPLPKVIDFGVARATQARLTEKTMFTQFHQMVGTPAYMSPEQTGLANLDIDTRSDIYSLGVLLYELLTGCTPFDASKLLEAGYEGIMRIIREVEPPKPSTRLSSLSVPELTALGGRRQEEPRRLGRLVQGDLDWIVMKALEKDRSRRYETAISFAQDLQRHLSNEPVTARSPSAAYRLHKLVARNKLAVAAGVVVTVALISGLVASTLAYYNEKSAHQFAVETSLSLQKAIADARTAQSSNGEALRQEAEKSVFAIQVMHAIVGHTAPSAITPEDKARILQLVDETVERLHHEPHIRPATKQLLLDNAGDIYLTFDEPARAEQAYRQVLSIRQIIMGADHPDTAAIQKKLDDIRRRQGKPAVTAVTSPAAQPKAVPRSRVYDGRVALRLARELRHQGRYTEADAELRKAVAAFKREYGPAPDRYILNEMARLHLDAGDFRGPKMLALYELEADRGDYGWFRYGFMAGLGISASRGSFYAHTMLGLIALREGTRAEAVQHLLQSANGIVNNTFMMGEFRFRAPELRLATELLAAKETAAVLEFLERLRAPYVDELTARGTTFFFNRTWEDYYTNSAMSRVHAEELAGWRQEILAGNIPTTWRKLLEDDRPATDLPQVPLESMEPLLADLPKLPSAWSGVLPSCAFLCLGWIVVGLGTYRLAPGHLPSPADKLLVALAAVRILGCAFFAGTFFVDGFRPDGLIIFVLTVAGWRLLWDFIHVLAPTVATRRETTLIHALSWTTVLIPVVLLVITYLSKDHWSLVLFAIGMLMTFLLSFVLMLSVFAMLVKLWKWKPEGRFRRAKVALLFSAPLVVLYGFACLSMPGFHDSHSNGAVLLLWADALFPWVLAAGLLGRKTAQAVPSLRPV